MFDNSIVIAGEHLAPLSEQVTVGNFVLFELC